MEIPRSFVIAGFRWKVKIVNGLKDEAGGKREGMTDATNRTIELDKAVTGEDRVLTFWHEYTHAVLYECGVSENTGGLSDIVEEIICDAMANALTYNFRAKYSPQKK